MRAGEHAHWPSQRTGSGMPSGVSTGDLPCASYLGPSAPSETEPNPIQSSRMPTFFFFLNIREMITICPRFWEPREQQDICMKASEGLELFSLNYGFPFNRYLFLNIYLIYNSIH